MYSKINFQGTQDIELGLCQLNWLPVKKLNDGILPHVSLRAKEKECFLDKSGVGITMLMEALGLSPSSLMHEACL